MDILETMKARHSVRQYKNQAIESSKREKINALIKDVNAESKLSIQVFYDEPKCFDSFMAHYGKFENVKNYIAIVGNKEDQEKKDIMMVPPIIGTKIAVSDHRSSNPQGPELIEVATATRRGGLLANVAGLVTMHMGSGIGKLDPLFYALNHSDVPAKNFLPTHMLRTRELMEEGAKLVRRGGYFDMTAGSTEEDMEIGAEQIMEILSWEGMSTDHLTMSSDAFGSQPKFNENGDCIGLTYCSPKYLHLTIKSLVRRGLPLEEAIKLLTSTPAELLGKTGVKGCVAVGADADLLVLDENLDIDALFAKGQVALLDKEIVLKGRFE